MNRLHSMVSSSRFTTLSTRFCVVFLAFLLICASVIGEVQSRVAQDQFRLLIAVASARQAATEVDVANGLSTEARAEYLVVIGKKQYGGSITPQKLSEIQASSKEAALEALAVVQRTNRLAAKVGFVGLVVAWLATISFGVTAALFLLSEWRRHTNKAFSAQDGSASL